MKSIHKTLLSAALCGLVIGFFAGCDNSDDPTPVQLPTEILNSGLTACLVGQSNLRSEAYSNEHGNSYYVTGWADTSIAVDRKNQIHVIFRDAGYNLRYSRKISEEGWLFARFALGEWRGCGGNNSMAIDQDGNVRMSLSVSDGCGENLGYIRGTPDQWLLSIIDHGSSVGMDNSLVVDKKGFSHITYKDWCSGELCYITLENGYWNRCSIAESCFAGQQIVVDDQDTVHVFYIYYYGYYFDNKFKIWHSSKINGVWGKELVGESLKGSYSISAAVDQNSNLYVVNQIGLYIKRDGNWQCQSIFDGMFDCQINFDKGSLAIDQDGNIHICLIGRSSDYTDIYYVSNTSGRWKAFSIDRWQASVFIFPRLAVGADGNVHIVYTKSTDWKVRYVTFNKNDLR